MELHFIFKYQIKCRQHAIWDLFQLAWQKKLNNFRNAFLRRRGERAVEIVQMSGEKTQRDIHKFIFSLYINKLCWRHLIWYLKIKCNSTKPITICCKWTMPLLIHSADFNTTNLDFFWKEKHCFRLLSIVDKKYLGS